MNVEKVINTKQLSELTGISASSLHKVWKNKTHKLHKVLKKQGFNVENFNKGIIPQNSLYIILHYYSFNSQYTTITAFNNFSELRFERNGELFTNIDNNLEVKNSYVYLFSDSIRGVCKIGVSKNVHRRFREVQSGYPFSLEISGVIKGGFKEEKAIHKNFNQYRIRFKLDEELQSIFNVEQWETEWFIYNKKIERMFKLSI